MSNTVFTNLPRFDVPVSASGFDLLQSFLPDASGDTPEPAAEPANDTLPPDPVDQTAPIEAALALLSDAASKLDQENEARIVSIVQAMAAKLFPELSRLFLAEEIARHLPELLPASAPTIEIRAQPELAKNLQQIIARTDTLYERCTIVAAKTPQDDRVQVSWASGGLTFDFSSLLSACLAQMGPHQTKIAE